MHAKEPDVEMPTLASPYVPPYVHTQLVRRVYALVSMQLGATALTAWALAPLWVSPLQALHAGLLSIVFGLGFLCAFASARGRHPWNLVAFLGVTAAQAVGVSATCALYDPHAVVASASSAAALFVLLGAGTWVLGRPPRDLEAVALSLLLLAGVLGIFAPVTQGSVWGAAGVMAMVLFVVHDTGTLRDLTPDHALDAALQLYLDALNLFACLLATSSE
jgi:FtsH-binding integral membrane protein